MKLLFENWREFVQINEAINPITIKKIESSISQAGGESYIVGGAVRDELMPDTPPSKDVDFLIRGLTLKNIADALAPLGKVSEVGQAFGVVTATIDGEEFDFAIPRTSETKTGDKHTDFEVVTDPSASVESDLGRRDFTINAIAKDSGGRIIDLFGGLEDLQNKVIRAVGDPDSRFKEDPLRMLRAIQFAARFGFTIEAETLKAIRKNINLVKSVAGERVLLELRKAWTKGSHNTDVLVNLLDQTGMGSIIFGQDFSPYSIEVSGNNKDKVIGNFIAFFLKGGNYEVMRPTREMVQYLNIAKQAALGDKKVYEYASGQRDKLSLIANVLDSVGLSRQSQEINNSLNLPISVRELDINGKQMMDLGLKGQQIGSAFKKVLSAIYDGYIQNDYEEIRKFLTR